MAPGSSGLKIITLGLYGARWAPIRPVLIFLTLGLYGPCRPFRPSNRSLKYYYSSPKGCVNIFNLCAVRPSVGPKWALQYWHNICNYIGPAGQC